MDIDQGGISAPRIALLGGGRMGFALLKGWLVRGVPGASVSVVEPSPSPPLVELVSKSGSSIVGIGEALAADVLVLAVKPQVIADTATQARALLAPQGLVLSIMAGTTTAELRRLFPGAASVVRAMPNLAASVGQGASVVVAERCLPGHRVIAERLLTDVGLVEWLPHESLMDAATALSGSGPGYVFYITECLERAGITAGLPRDTAARLARATVQGAGAVLTEFAEGPERLRQQVSSPGGTTEAGLAVLMADDRLQSLLDATLTAAAQRSRELGSGQPASRKEGMMATTKSEVSSAQEDTPGPSRVSE